MKKERVKTLALEIIALDLKRDELYEELKVLAGGQADAILRFVQNGNVVMKSE